MTAPLASMEDPALVAALIEQWEQAIAGRAVFRILRTIVDLIENLHLPLPLMTHD